MSLPRAFLFREQRLSQLLHSRYHKPPERYEIEAGTQYAR